MITKTGDTTYEAEHRGTQYYLRLDVLGRWEVWSRRKALGRMNVGSIRHFDTLAEVSDQITAFQGLTALLAEPVGTVSLYVA